VGGVDALPERLLISTFTRWAARFLRLQLSLCNCRCSLRVGYYLRSSEHPPRMGLL